MVDTRTALAWIGCLIASILMTAQASAGGDDFYKNKTITFTVGSSAGGGYDTYSRLIASHIGRHIPGNPTVIVQNMPGAGSIRAANFLYNAAPKDGTAIGMIDQAIYLNQILGTHGLKVDALQFNWIGRILDNSAVLFDSQRSPVKQVQDAMENKLIVATSGTASHLNWTVLKAVVGVKFQLMTGYRGTNDALLAMLRGEVDALSMPWSILKIQGAEMMAKKEINLLLQTGAEKNADIPNVPRMIDLAHNDEDRALLALFSTPSTVGRSVLAPPGLPPERVKVLRAAFSATIHDPKFLEDVKHAKLELDPLPGEALEAQMQRAGKFPPSVIARARKIAESKQ
jgi:tripartite-type tricarboxylate transporter receptor subunit TctC